MLDHDAFKYYKLIIRSPIMVALDINTKIINQEIVPSKMISREIEL